MDVQTAIALLGTACTRHELRQMVLALKLHAWRNSEIQRARLVAAEWILKNWKTYTAEVERKRTRRAAA